MNDIIDSKFEKEVHVKKLKPARIPLYKAVFRSMINLYPDDKTAYSKVSVAAVSHPLVPGPPIEIYPCHPPPPRASVKYRDIQPYPSSRKGGSITNRDDILRFKPYKY